MVKVFVSSKGTCNNYLFNKVFNCFLKCGNKIFDFLTSNSKQLKVHHFRDDKKVEEHCSTFNTGSNI